MSSLSLFCVQRRRWWRQPTLHAPRIWVTAPYNSIIQIHTRSLRRLGNKQTATVVLWPSLYSLSLLLLSFTVSHSLLNALLSLSFSPPLSTLHSRQRVASCGPRFALNSRDHISSRPIQSFYETSFSLIPQGYFIFFIWFWFLFK